MSDLEYKEYLREKRELARQQESEGAWEDHTVEVPIAVCVTCGEKRVSRPGLCSCDYGESEGVVVEIHEGAIVGKFLSTPNGFYILTEKE